MRELLANTLLTSTGDVVVPIVVAIISSGVLLGLVQLWVAKSDRQVGRDASVVDTASDVVSILRAELDAERDRRTRVTQELSDRVAALEARLEAADERAERYASALWEAQRELGKKDVELGRKDLELAKAHADLKALGDSRRPSDD